MLLFYKISGFYLKREEDRVFSLFIFSLLPGVNSAALLVYNAVFVIFFNLLFVYLFEKGLRVLYLGLLIILLFVDKSFMILFFSLLLYSIYKKDRFLSAFSLALFMFSLSIYGFDTGGKPKGYFLDTMGVYSAIFSPLLFIYFFYCMYRILIKEDKNILWFISFGAMGLSLLLSFRQRLALEEFAPFVVISVPLMIRSFYASYRVRLKPFRKWYGFAMICVVSTLILNFLVTFFNKPLYILTQNKPSKHFAYNFQVAKELAAKLKKDDIYKIDCDNKRLQLRLKFYDIKYGNDYQLSQKKSENAKEIVIKYFDIPVAKFYLLKLNSP
jgi:hypothetical protein